MDESSVQTSEGGVTTLERPPLWYQPTEKERLLRRNEVGNFRELESGHKRVWYGEVEGLGGVIFKPEKYSDIEHERAAYLISDIVGFDFVPATVLRKVGSVRGSLQEFVEDAKSIDDLDSTDQIRDGLYKYWLFRHIMRNPDGHDYNFIVKDGKLISIDHEASFDSDTPDASYYDEWRNYYGEDVPPELVDIFRSFLADDRRREILRSSLEREVSKEDTDVTIRRIEEIGRILMEKGRIDSKEELNIL